MPNPLILFISVVLLCLLVSSILGVFWLYLYAETAMNTRSAQRWIRIRQLTFGTVLLCFIVVLMSYLFYLA